MKFLFIKFTIIYYEPKLSFSIDINRYIEDLNVLLNGDFAYYDKACVLSMKDSDFRPLVSELKAAALNGVNEIKKAGLWLKVLLRDISITDLPEENAIYVDDATALKLFKSIPNPCSPTLKPQQMWSGGGTTLFSAVSFAICHSTKYENLFKLKTVIEITENQSFYTTAKTEAEKMAETGLTLVKMFCNGVDQELFNLANEQNVGVISLGALSSVVGRRCPSRT